MELNQEDSPAYGKQNGLPISIRSDTGQARSRIRQSPAAIARAVRSRPWANLPPVREPGGGPIELGRQRWARDSSAPPSARFDGPRSEESGSMHGCIRRRPRPGGSSVPPGAVESIGASRLQLPQAAVRRPARPSRTPCRPHAENSHRTRRPLHQGPGRTAGSSRRGKACPHKR